MTIEFVLLYFLNSLYGKETELKFGDVLREPRKKCNLSQEKLAQECDIDRTFISLLERGNGQSSLAKGKKRSRIKRIGTDD